MVVKMKYFILQDSPDLKYCPKISNWYGKFDVRNIRLDKYPELPEQELFLLEPTEKVIFTDIILFPFLLVSPMIRDVIKMYQEICYFRQVLLLDKKHEKSEIYYLPVVSEFDGIQLVRNTYDENGQFSCIEQKLGEPLIVNKNIFWVRDSVKRYTIISLDFAESLLRRNVIGLGIQEILLYCKGEEK